MAGRTRSQAQPPSGKEPLRPADFLNTKSSLSGAKDRGDSGRDVLFDRAQWDKKNSSFIIKKPKIMVRSWLHLRIFTPN